MDKDWRVNNHNHDYINGEDFDHWSPAAATPSSPPRSLPVSSPPSTAVGVGAHGGANYIIHTVTKFDTLAGVAIKYGVEVADIKRLNGLVTDLQMFALKTLQIPLPGRHPPSSTLSNGMETPPRPSTSEQKPSFRRHSDFFDSFQSLRLKASPDREVSPAMSVLQGYYGLKDRKSAEGFEMSTYRKGAHYLEDGPFSKASPASNPPLSRNRKSKSVANGFFSENGDVADHLTCQEATNRESDSWIDKLVRRRQKSEADFTRTPEMLLEDSNSSGGFSTITGKGLALRPKSASRTSSGVDAEAGGVNPIPIGLGDSLTSDSTGGVVRKSSSTSSLQDSDNSSSTSSSIWPTSKWSLKADFQALSTAAITRPIFDGLPKPMGRRNKAAVD